MIQGLINYFSKIQPIPGVIPDHEQDEQRHAFENQVKDICMFNYAQKYFT